MSPYLFFAGRAEEAMEFYSRVLGAKVEMMMRFNESPDPMPPDMPLPAGFETKIMHASLMIQGTRLMLSDGMDDKMKFEGFRMALSVPTEAEAHAAFNGLASEGGKVEMPLMKTFWSPCYGMVTDKFNLGWMVMLADEPAQD